MTELLHGARLSSVGYTLPPADRRPDVGAAAGCFGPFPIQFGRECAGPAAAASLGRSQGVGMKIKPAQP